MSCIGIVVVTYNRLEKLKITMECFDKQTVPPKYVLVIDNASTDGTAEYLKQWETSYSQYNKHVIRNNKNLGGSGGFYTGLNAALNMNADWIWYLMMMLFQRIMHFRLQNSI
jgi:GT2 family glycosyltransferase